MLRLEVELSMALLGCRWGPGAGAAGLSLQQRQQAAGSVEVGHSGMCMHT